MGPFFNQKGALISLLKHCVSLRNNRRNIAIPLGMITAILQRKTLYVYAQSLKGLCILYTPPSSKKVVCTVCAPSSKKEHTLCMCAPSSKKEHTYTVCAPSSKKEHTQYTPPSSKKVVCTVCTIPLGIVHTRKEFSFAGLQ